MFISKLSLPRRTFLRGVGATVALPFLEAMVPAMTATAKTAANAPRRWGAVFFPNGAIMEQWSPATTGVDFDFSPSLKPLEGFRDSLVVVSNLTRAGTTAGDHAVSAAGWLTGVYAKRTEAEDVRANTTIDQVVAKQIGQDTPFPSLELATEDFTGYVGACTVGFSCVYANTICWSSPTTPLPMEINPRVVFERLFGEPGTPEQRRAQRQRDLSILDVITEEANALRRGLGARDRTRLGEYLDNVREIERRIQRSEEHSRTDADHARRAGRHPGFVRRARRADVRPDGRGLSDRPDARRDLHDVAGAEPADLSADRRVGSAPRRVASRQRSREDCQGRPDQRLSREAVRDVPGEAAIDAGW